MVSGSAASAAGPVWRRWILLWIHRRLPRAVQALGGAQGRRPRRPKRLLGTERAEGAIQLGLLSPN